MGCVGESRGKVHSEMIKLTHPEGEGYKMESLLLGPVKNPCQIDRLKI